MYESTNLTRPEFLTRYIKPFYMDLMNMNFVRKPEEYTNKMFNQLKNLSNELSDELLTDMLNDAWRPSKVGAWMIGLSNRKALKKELKNYLDITPANYTEHVLINFYLLLKANSNTDIMKFVERQADYFTSKDGYIEIGYLSIHWATGLLKFIDKKHDQQNIMNMQSSEWWSNFMNHIKQKKDMDLILELLNSNHYFETIEETIERIEINRIKKGL